MGKFILNGKVYTGNSADGFPPLIYSDEEREIGVWHDGKPLYQKVINVGSLPQTANTAKNVEHNISNIDTVCLLRGAVKNSGGTILPLPYIAPDNLSYGIQLSATSTYIVLRTGTDRSAFSGYAIIQYTKTTDTAGSGYWATNGDRAIHYSTTEQVIGTWVDGKPLYEKTIEFGSLPNNTVKNVAHNISNIKKVICISGYASLPNTLIVMPLPYANPGNTSAQVGVIINNSNIEITSGSDRSGFTESYITIRYTKTTD